MQYGCLKLAHFPKKSDRLSSTGPGILIFGSHCSANFQLILDCFIPKFKLEYDDLENIKTDRVSTGVFSLHQVKRLKFFGTPGTLALKKTRRSISMAFDGIYEVLVTDLQIGARLVGCYILGKI